ncbi:MAG: NAD(P)-dependent oxidoreductase [Alphaproteobacteria bacterium]|nr:NAD(P)-dependent oxidoreductase [Alphaproteobacteria bacterium]
MAVRAGVIGLGIMGGAIAPNLIGAGLTVTGYDVDKAKIAALRKAGGKPAWSAADVAGAADVVLTLLPSVAALDATAAALAASGHSGIVVCECSTLPIADKQRAHAVLADAGIELLDTPLSGTGTQAITRDLVVYSSGKRAAHDRAKPVFEGFARLNYYLGALGNGSKMKFVANHLVAVHNVATAEAFVLGMKAGLDPETIYEVISSGAGTSRMFEVRGRMIVADKYEPAGMRNEIWQKDMTIIGAFARELGVPVPVFHAAGEAYTAAIAQGLAKLDTAATFEVVADAARYRRAPAGGRTKPAKRAAKPRAKTRQTRR